MRKACLSSGHNVRLQRRRSSTKYVDKGIVTIECPSNLDLCKHTLETSKLRSGNDCWLMVRAVLIEQSVGAQEDQ